MVLTELGDALWPTEASIDGGLTVDPAIATAIHAESSAWRGRESLSLMCTG